MQPLTAAPRQELTDLEVFELLTGDSPTIVAGLELLDQDNRLVEDITDDLQAEGSRVTHEGRADVHGKCDLKILRELAWGRDRVRPYLTISEGAVSARFNLGVYVLNTPVRAREESPVTYDVTGYDLLQLLQVDIGDTWVAEAGETVLEAVQAAVTASGVGAVLHVDGTAIDAVLAEPMVWALADGAGATWLRVINDLLASISYRGLYADLDGNLRAEPYLAPRLRAETWTFDTSDPATNLVGREGTVEEDLWRKPNRWRFIRRGMTTTPVEGDGIYTVDNLDVGLSSQQSVGRVVPDSPRFLDAVDHASLVAQGDRIVADDMASVRKLSLSIDPLPIVEHLDVVRVIDLGRADRAQVTASETCLDGKPGRWEFEVVI